MGSSADAASLSCARFLEIFLKEFVPQSLWDTWHAKYEQLFQGTMSLSEYAIKFSDLFRHAHAMVATVRERVCRFIEGLRYESVRRERKGRLRGLADSRDLLVFTLEEGYDMVEVFWVIQFSWHFKICMVF